jgi:hypothetical protein
MVVEESGAEKFSKTALSLAADDALDGWVMLMLPTLHLFIKQEDTQANRLLGNRILYVPNFGHSEVLIRMTDERLQRTIVH